jgi:hypothetical protein
MHTSGEDSPKSAKRSSQKPPVPEETGTSWQFLLVIGVVIFGIAALIIKAIIGM